MIAPTSLNILNLSITQLFEERALCYGDRLAIKYQDRTITYKQLNGLANRIARAIVKKRGIGAEPIALLFKTGPEAIAAMLGVLKAGKFYVPLDVSWPKTRLDSILEDSQTEIILSDRRQFQITELGDRDVLWLHTLEPELSSENLEIQSHPDDLAYILYTSGSSGRPKGVMQNHRYVLNLYRNYTNTGGMTESDRFSLLYSAAFGGAVRDIYCSLLNGAALFPLDVKEIGLHQLGRWLQDNKITVMFAVATLFRHFAATLKGEEHFPKLRLIQIGSETVYRQDAELFQEHFNSGCTLMVNLGGTEISPVRQFPITKDTVLTGSTVPAGYGVEGTEVWLWDELGREVPPGEVGEIVVSSRQLSLGYWCRAELTERAFVSDGDRRYFKTGDLGRLLPDGCLLHLGRKDFQVKIRGYRVETSEVEGALSSLESVREAVVVARTDEGGAPGDCILVAYLTAVNSENQLTAKELKEAMAERLPDYAIPSCFLWLESLPLTATGKIDRRSLPQPPSLSTSDLAIVPPQTPTEEILVKIWSEVLKLPEIGRENNFFDLGGNSLHASQILARISEQLGIDLSLKTIFEAPAIAQFAEYLDSAKKGTTLPPLIPTSKKGNIPLSLAQRRLWFLERLETNKAIYNLFRGFRLTGEIEVLCLEKALQEIVARHEILRTTFTEIDGIPVQEIAASFSGNLNIANLQNLSPKEQTKKVAEIVAEMRGFAFDLTRLPLYKFVLVRLSDREARLLLTFHHIIADDWSLQVFLKELSLLYEAFIGDRPSPLPPLPIQYADYTRWQHQYLTGEAMEKQLDYWRSQLAETPPLLDLPTDFSRTSAAGFESGIVPLNIDRETTQKLKALSKRSQTTLFVTLLTALAVLLFRYSDREDIVIGTGIANRNPAITEELIGFFVSTLALRIQLADNPTFLTLLDRVWQTALDARAHADVPFDRLVEALSIERHLGHNPLFQVLFVLQNVTQELLTFPEVETEELDWTQPTAGATFDLTLSLRETAESGLQGSLEYNAKLFEAETIDRMAKHFQTLLKAIAETPESPVGFLPLLNQRERDLLVVPQEDIPAPPDRCLHQWFAMQVEKTPDAIAARCEERQLTYRELNERANQLARYLQGLGVEPDTLVGLCVERSLETIIGILGIIKAGGAYVPLDPANPQARLDYIAQDSQIEFLVTQSGLSDKISHCREIICLDGDWEKIAQQNSLNPTREVKGQNLAYVIYTSGSTGQPKGVLVTHENVTRLFAATESWYGFKETDIWTLFHSYSFDFSVWEMWGALLYGGRLVVVPYWTSRDTSAFYKLLASEGVTVLNQTPSAFYQLIQADDVARAKLHLRWVIFGGEALELSALAPWFDRHGDRQPQLVNMYGITETTVHVTYRPLSLADLQITHSPIGIPIPDLQIYLLDRHLQPVPQGARGEMYIGGCGATKGYLHRDALTRDRFIDNPFDETKGKLYKTGDLARYLPNGELVYLGRIDNQVKIRGFRIELGEIEAILSQHPAIRESAVQVRRDRTGDRQIVAYVVPDRQQTFPLLKLAELRTKGELTNRNLYELPNGMTVSHLNRSESEFLYQEIFSEQSYLQHGIAIAPGDSIFDVGANIGLFTLFAAQICPDVEVYAFEPIPPIFECLRFNAELYEINAKLFDCGLGNETKQAEFTYYPNVSVISGQFADLGEEKETVQSFLLNQQPQNGETTRSLETLDELLAERLQSDRFTCQLRTLSDIIREHRLERIDLLKIDVEKSEGDVLAGIQADDWSKIKQIVVEVHDLDGRLRKITDLLKGHGYELSIIQDRLLEKTPLYSIYARRLSPQAPGVPKSDRQSISRPTWSSFNRFTRDIRHYLKEKLPEYAIPSSISVIERFPLTANGKIDFRALPLLDVEAEPEEFVPPRTPTETAIAKIVTEVLGRERVGIHDNFFALGGHSLLAIKVISRSREKFAVELPVRSLFESPTVAELAELIANSQEAIAAALIPTTSEGQPLPLSFAQTRLWFLDRLEAAPNATYNVTVAVEITGPLDVAALERSLQEIIRRHAILRTRISMVNGIPHQAIAPAKKFQLNLQTIEKNPLERQRFLRERATAQAETPFDLERDDPVRVSLWQWSRENYAFFLTLHHIVSDGRSIELFLGELSTLYAAFAIARPSPLPDLPIQYPDYAAWQRQRLTGAVLETQLNYWKQQLAGISSPINLPTDRPRPPVQTFRGGRVPFQLDASLCQRLRTLARANQSTLFMTLLAAFAVLLSRYSSQDDIPIGVPVTNRSHHQTESLIGFFVNTVVLRTRMEGNPSFQDLLLRVRQVALDAYSHQELPFDKVVEALQPERSPSYSPLFQVMFTLETAPTYGEFPGLTIAPIEWENKTAKFDLTLSIVEEADGLAGNWEYNLDLFDRETIARTNRCWQTLLEGIVANPEMPVEQLPLLPPEERHRLLVEWNQTERNYPERNVLELFAETVRRQPEAIALQDRDRQITYGELDEKSDRLAGYLQSLGVGAETIVGICLERSPEIILGLWAILKAGGAYVPIDPAFPPERIAYILQDTQLSILLTRPHLAANFCHSKVFVADMDLDWQSFAPPALVPAELPRDRLAYVIYTSGSTGKPKGVEICHGALANLVMEAIANYPIADRDRLLQFFSFSFDAVALEIYPCLCAGGTLVLRTDEMLASSEQFWQQCREWQITVLNIPTAYWHLLAANLTKKTQLPSSLQLITIGGEQALPASLAQWQDYIAELPHPPKLINAYGPTEATVETTIYPVTTVHGKSLTLPIGKPIGNVKVYVLDRQMQPVPVGVAGELYIGGAGLARGYLRRPELTAEKFVPNPFGEGRLYKTGDLVRYLPDGNLEFIGRLDRQVKLRGFRIELGEIESILSQLESVREAVAILHEDSQGNKRSIAYVVLRETVKIQETLAHLKVKLREALPEYMVPEAIVPLSALPLTVTGKVDRRALPAPPPRQRASPTEGLPQNAIEREIAKIWESILAVDSISREENFFDLGGTSLLAIQACQGLNDRFQTGFSIVEMFLYPTIQSLADRIRQQEEAPVLRRDRDKSRSQQQRQKRRESRQKR